MSFVWIAQNDDTDAKQHTREDCPSLHRSETEQVPADECDRDRCANCHDDIQIAPKGGTVAKLWEMDPDEVGRSDTEGSA